MERGLVNCTRYIRVGIGTWKRGSHKWGTLKWDVWCFKGKRLRMEGNSGKKEPSCGLWIPTFYLKYCMDRNDYKSHLWCNFTKVKLFWHIAPAWELHLEKTQNVSNANKLIKHYFVTVYINFKRECMKTTAELMASFHSHSSWPLIIVLRIHLTLWLISAVRVYLMFKLHSTQFVSYHQPLILLSLSRSYFVHILCIEHWEQGELNIYFRLITRFFSFSLSVSTVYVLQVFEN